MGLEGMARRTAFTGTKRKRCSCVVSPLYMRYTHASRSLFPQGPCPRPCKNLEVWQRPRLPSALRAPDRQTNKHKQTQTWGSPNTREKGKASPGAEISSGSPQGKIAC